MTQYDPDLYREFARTKPARLDLAQQMLARVEHVGSVKTVAVQPTGFDAVDAILPQDGAGRAGLTRGAMHEVLGLAARRFACGVLGECLSDPAAAPVLWAVPVMAGECLYGPGLAQRGVDPNRLIVARYRTASDGLWLLEEALKSGAFSAVIGDLRDPLGTTAARRLHLAAETGCALGLILSDGSMPLTAPGSVTSRWRAEPASAEVQGGLDRRFHLSLDRHRGYLEAGHHWTVQDN